MDKPKQIPEQLNTFVKLAKTAADKASNVINNHAQEKQIFQKGHPNDFATSVDRDAEKVIIDTIKQAFPEHDILAEESDNAANRASDYCWIIDPIDGTSNFMHGFPHYSTSIALSFKDELIIGVVNDPVRNECFSAIKNGGAFCNDEPIKVSNHPSLQGAFVGTGFPCKRHDLLEKYLKSFEIIFPKTSGIRRAGSVALELAYLAAGRLDGFFEMDLKPWDIAAASLLITEAGGTVNDFYGENNQLQNGDVVAGSSATVVDELISDLKPIWK